MTTTTSDRFDLRATVLALWNAGCDLDRKRTNRLLDEFYADGGEDACHRVELALRLMRVIDRINRQTNGRPPTHVENLGQIRLACLLADGLIDDEATS